MREIKPLKNEEGAVLVIALVLLGLLAILGVAATNTSTLEVKIAANNRIYTENFYMAEAAVRESIQRLRGGEDIDTWKTANDVDLTVPENWTDDNDTHLSQVIDDGFTRYAAVGPYIQTEGGNLSNTDNQSKDMTKESTLVYIVYGFYNNPARGRVLVDMGLRIKPQ